MIFFVIASTALIYVFHFYSLHVSLLMVCIYGAVLPRYLGSNLYPCLLLAYLSVKFHVQLNSFKGNSGRNNCFPSSFSPN